VPRLPLLANATHTFNSDEAANALALEHMLDNGRFSFYNWGGFVHLRGEGRLKVFVDGRSETVYADEIFRRYMRVLHQERLQPADLGQLLHPLGDVLRRADQEVARLENSQSSLVPGGALARVREHLRPRKGSL
jgi:hypothetical protein